MDLLEKAREIVVEDPGILGGTPVIKGTRVPVHDVAAQFVAGTPVDEILRCYPSVKERQIELASVYARAFPAPKRPKKSFANVERVKVVKRKRLPLSAMSNRSGETIS